MTGRAERACADRLRDAAAGLLHLQDDMPQRIRDAAVDALNARDLLEIIARADALVMALEDLHARAKQCAETLDAALLEAMQESGAGSLKLPHHTLVVVESSGRPRITDRAAVPPRFLRARDPEPDMKAIGAAMKAGERFPWAEQSNGGAHLRRVGRS